jgi:N-acyl homoserine lactone hydrolase
MTQVRRLFILLVGYEVLPKSISTKDIGARFMIASPICCYLLDTAEGWMLLDAGFDPKYARDKELVARYFDAIGMHPPVVNPEHELPLQFEQVGVGFDDIRHVVLSHLHLDHAGYIKYFKSAEVHIQHDEYLHGLSDARPNSYFLEDYNSPDIRWRLHDGDWELIPGVRLIRTPGHTPGHQSAIIELPRSGTCVLTFDAGDFQENYDLEILPGESVDDAAALASIRRLKMVASQPRAQMILFHDPMAIQRYKLAPDCYD